MTRHLSGHLPIPSLKYGAVACAALACIAIALASLAGCRGEAPARGQLNLALAVFPSEAAAYANFVSTFEAAHHVRINIVAQSYGDILQALRVQARSRRSSLDLVELDLAMLGEARSNVAVLDELVPPSAHSLFSGPAWAAATENNHVYFIPHRLMWQAMIYNRIEVPDPPRTWDDLARFARAHPGKLALKAARYEGAACDVMAFVWSAGGGECDPESSGSLRAFDFLHSLAPDLNANPPCSARCRCWRRRRAATCGFISTGPSRSVSEVKGPCLPGRSERADSGRSQREATPLGGGYLAIPRFRAASRRGRASSLPVCSPTERSPLEPSTWMVRFGAAAAGQRGRKTLCRIHRDERSCAGTAGGPLLSATE